MSLTMAEQRKLEEENLEKELKEEEEAMKTDACPHCLQLVSTFPYIAPLPTMGWIECAACGVVFSPKSIRNLKMKRKNSGIILPKDPL